ncbi:MAG: HAD family phosphatase [Clostridia bacterium]|nr:HAD family phosphatase [Clostridia bacterium]
MEKGIRFDLAYDTMPWDEVDTVVFDIGNVLIRFAPEEFVKRLFPGDEQTQKLMLERVYFGKYWPEFDRGTMSYEQAAKLLDEEFGGGEALYLRTLYGWIALKTPLEEGWRAARLCKAKGKRICLLSNYPAEGYAALREQYAERFDLFDGACISCQIHQVKPNADIYQTLKETCGVQSGRAVFIDDLLANVEGAMQAGIHGFHMHEIGMMDRFFR